MITWNEVMIWTCLIGIALLSIEVIMLERKYEKRLQKLEAKSQ